jgi:cytochrome c oxidase subunit 3
MTAAREPWPSLDRQREADRFGMMVFLASEIMLFGALFGVANALMMLHRPEVEGASRRLDLWIGGINTAILLTSSLLVAIGVEARRTRPRRTALTFLGAALLGLAFLGVKAFEYAKDYHEGLMPGTAIAHFASGPERLFIDLYFIATGLHGLHVTIGVVLLGGIAWRARSSRPPTGVAIENVGLYWHLVDVIWVFLYPVLYLMRG